MALGPSRFVRVGESPYAHEEEGIQFLQQALPNSDPYQGWALLELPDPSTGRLLEIDALIHEVNFTSKCRLDGFWSGEETFEAPEVPEGQATPLRMSHS